MKPLPVEQLQSKSWQHHLHTMFHGSRMYKAQAASKNQTKTENKGESKKSDKDKSGKEFKIEQEEMKKPSGSQSLTCDCTCNCNGKVFTTTVYPCKNRELACEKSCKQKCK